MIKPKIVHWRFNEFRCPPGEVYFDAGETAAIARWGMPRPVVIEPTVKDHGACVGANKQWPVERYLQVAAGLMDDGAFPVSLGPTRGGWDMLPRVVTATFREALCILSLARLYIGPAACITRRLRSAFRPSSSSAALARRRRPAIRGIRTSPRRASRADQSPTARTAAMRWLRSRSSACLRRRARSWTQRTPSAGGCLPESPSGGRRHVRNDRMSVGFCCTAAKEVQCHKPT
jgi:hypothetical protein